MESRTESMRKMGDTGITVPNSLSGQNEPFVTMKEGRVLWYSCGPTVYDSAHLGHARTYMSQDIIIRILRDYFKLNVIFVMNITDIDDKIIKRAGEKNVDFSILTRKFETEYFEDMESLSIQRPNFITRVSEHIPEIIDMIGTIIKNGYAYVSNSVYFDYEAFSKDHKYWTLVTDEASNGMNDEAEAGGDSDKRNDKDFALWKAAKPGEPFWDSPWGKGRPGWHIECSAMSYSVFKHFGNGCIDVHSGGVDLKFPHHQNEMAQSEAFMAAVQPHDGPTADVGPVKYFLHTGHLNINGLKMSKSLKNFFTIRDVMTEFNANELRMLFLLHNWNTVMNYNPDSLLEARQKWRQFRHFIQSVKCDPSPPRASVDEKLGEDEWKLVEQFESAKESIHSSLLNAFNTEGALATLGKLCDDVTNYYMLTTRFAKHSLVDVVVAFVTSILSMLGLDLSVPNPLITRSSIEHLVNARDCLRRGESTMKQDTQRHLLMAAITEFCNQDQQSQIMSTFEASVMNNTVDNVEILNSIPHSTDDVHQRLMNELKSLWVTCLSDDLAKKRYESADSIRSLLMLFGVRLVDKSTSTVSYVETPTDLIREDLELKKMKQQKESSSTKGNASSAKGKEKSNDDSTRVNTLSRIRDLMKVMTEYHSTESYSQWDEVGCPIADSTGKEIAKSQVKKLKKSITEKTNKLLKLKKDADKTKDAERSNWLISLVYLVSMGEWEKCVAFISNCEDALSALEVTSKDSICITEESQAMSYVVSTMKGWNYEITA